MKTNRLLPIFCCLFIYSQMHSQCPDPVIQIVSDCGTEFDLCLDNYSTPVDQGVLLDVFINDDLGIFDPCDSDTLSGTSNGTLTQLPNCNWYYVPSSGFVGKDTFFYILNYLDTCLTQCICESGPGCLEGRIWTIDAIYLGEDATDNSSYDPTVLVKDKSDNTFSTHEHLSYGDDFFADGSSLLPSTTSYEYQLYLDGDTSLVPDQIELVHVSCSQNIFESTFGFLRPISGCIASTSEQLTCAGVGDNFKSKKLDVENRSAIGEAVTTATADTAMVIITIEAIVPVDIIAFRGNALGDVNRISWQLNNYNSALIELEGSINGRDFESIYSYVPLGTVLSDSYDDVSQAYQYYRLAIYDHDGTFNYSDIIIIKNQYSLSKGISIYPNPFREEFVLSLSGNAIHTISIFNSSGQKVYEQIGDFNDENEQIIFNYNFESGLYFVQMIGKEISETQRIIKI